MTMQGEGIDLQQIPSHSLNDWGLVYAESVLLHYEWEHLEVGVA